MYLISTTFLGCVIALLKNALHATKKNWWAIHHLCHHYNPLYILHSPNKNKSNTWVKLGIITSCWRYCWERVRTCHILWRYEDRREKGSLCATHTLRRLLLPSHFAHPDWWKQIHSDVLRNESLTLRVSFYLAVQNTSEYEQWGIICVQIQCNMSHSVLTNLVTLEDYNK